MLKVPELNDITYDQMVQRAIHKISSMTQQWTDFNYHDPGITVLQTYAWLVDMLNYYMDATGDIHRRKYLKLLGIQPEEAKAAHVYLNLQSDKGAVTLPEGTPVYAQDICFETTREARIQTNRLISYWNEVDGAGMDLTMFAGSDGDYAEVFAKEFSDQAVAYFGFEQELSGQVVLQICVKENPARNPFEKGFAMGTLTWEYYGADGWKPLEQVEDSTSGFLQSGLWRAKFPEATRLCSCAQGARPAHYIRCILKENFYDELPRIGRIYVNPVLAEQKKTLSRMVEIPYQGQKQIRIPCYVPENAYLMVGISEQSGQGHLIYDEGSEYENDIQVKTGEHPYERVLLFPEGKAKPEQGSILQVFFVREEFFAEFRQEVTDGCANQEISFPYEGIYEISVSTWSEEKDGRHRYEIWKYIPMLEQADYRDHVFTYDFEEKKIVFGDGEHGAVPRQGQRICITGLCTSEFSRGNIMEREINCMAEDMAGMEITLTNPQEACGGRDQDTMEMLLKRMQQELFSQKRLVSPADYKEAVAATPGLMIEAVEVISGRRYGEIHDVDWNENEVVVVVKPHSAQKRPMLSSFYQEKIAEHLEDLRLINTKVTIVSPSYVGIEVNGKIRLAHKKPGEKEQVEKLLEALILKNDRAGGFGKRLVLGKIFSILETAGEVECVESLSLERLGDGAVKNQRGDINLYEDALCYISGMDIEFC